MTVANKVELETKLHDNKAIITNQLDDIEQKAESLSQSISTIKKEDWSNKKFESYRSLLDSVGRELVNLKNHTQQSTQSLLRRTPNHLHPYVNSKLSLYPWSYTLGGTRVVTMFSDIHSKIRDLNNGSGDVEQQNWVPPSTFDRSTHKYLVPPENITDVMLKCVEEVPILLYGKEDAITKANANSENDIWDTISTSITSIYFDSPSMALYNNRIKRIESAKLFRIRWYGNKPSGDHLVFLELKTHHEQWVQDKSVKERVALCAKDISQVLVRDYRSWTDADAIELIHNANPKLQGKELKDNANLLLRIRYLIMKKNLRPCVRSHYRRVAFQSNTNNDLRFTIDRDIELSSEASAPLGSWCREDNKEVKSVTMPVGVFEVKLSGVESPKWVDELLHTNKIQDGHKFSKYLSGASMLYEESVSSLPYWAKDPLFCDFYDHQHADIEYRDVVKASKQEYSAIDSSQRTVASSDDLSDSSSSGNASDQGSTKKSITFAIQALFNRFRYKPISAKNRVKIEPKTYFAAERTFIQWISASLLLVTISALLFALSEQKGGNGIRINGMVLLFTALFLSVYALVVYFRRLHLMKNSKPYGYTDQFAPVILTVAVLAGIGSILYHTIPFHNGSQTTVIEVKGSCYRLPYTGMSLLEYQPSDLIIDRARNVAVVPSNNQITSIELEGEDHRVRVIGSAPFEDFEATVFVGDILFAVSELSKLYAFRWSDDKQMIMVGRWALGGDVKASEGIAYRGPDGSFGKGQLLISSFDELAGVSQIHIFDVPEINHHLIEVDDPEVLAIRPLYQLNEKLMSNGINAKIGSMQVFEDVLYVLYDNAMSIRGFDRNTGVMVADIKLPKVGEGFNKQWEGMFFDRVKIDDKNIHRLRRSNVADEVKLHLALDSPPQIWTFTMTEYGKGAFSFPKCAAAE